MAYPGLSWARRPHKSEDTLELERTRRTLRLDLVTTARREMGTGIISVNQLH